MMTIFTQVLTGFNFRAALYVSSVLLTSKAQHTTQITTPNMTTTP